MLEINGYMINSDFHRNPLRLGSTQVNAHIPLICVNHMNAVEEGLYLYNKPLNGQFRADYKPNSIKNIVEALNRRTRLISTTASEDVPVYVGRGYMTLANDDLLLVLTVKREALFNELGKPKPKFEEYETVLFLSSQFFTNPGLANLYRRLVKEYIITCYEKGIEVRILPSQQIEQNTFSNEFRVEFTTISELDRHLTQDVSKLMYKPRLTPPVADSVADLSGTLLRRPIPIPILEEDSETESISIGETTVTIPTGYYHESDVIVGSNGVELQPISGQPGQYRIGVDPATDSGEVVVTTITTAEPDSVTVVDGVHWRSRRIAPEPTIELVDDTADTVETTTHINADAVVQIYSPISLEEEGEDEYSNVDFEEEWPEETGESQSESPTVEWNAEDDDLLSW